MSAEAQELQTDRLPIKGATEIIPAPRTETAAILNMIERASRDPAVDVDKLERLLQLRDNAIARQGEDDFNAAMSDAQGKMGRVSADASNPQTRSKYASFAALDRALRPIYAKHKFALSFDSETVSETVVRVKCYVTHRTPGSPGHTRMYHIDMPADGKGAKGGDVMTKTHATGAAVTYGRRYLLLMIFNIAVGEDDDGNAAAGAEPRITAEQVKQLEQLLKETNSDLNGYLQYINAPSLADIAAKHFNNAVDVLETKKKRAAAAKQEQAK
jgi:hypothetical protein